MKSYHPDEEAPTCKAIDMPNANPDILKWARTTAGMSLAEAANKIGIDDADGIVAADRLKLLELGHEAPTQAVLHKMSKHYRRSNLTFYLPEIPREDDVCGEDFRTRSKFFSAKNNALVDALHREIYLRHILVRSAMEIADEDNKLSFVNSTTCNQNPMLTASSIETHLNFDRNVFQKSQNRYKAFSYFRNLVQDLGIFVILFEKLGDWDTEFKTEFFRGFVLTDDIVPFIAINAHDSPEAWSFTLACELAHIWIGKSGTSDYTIRHPVEKFCNDVASELLLPSSQIKTIKITKKSSSDHITKELTKFAKKKNVCNLSVGYRLFRSGLITDKQFKNIVDLHHEIQDGEGNLDKWYLKLNGFDISDPHFISKFYIGDALIDFVRRMMDGGNLPVTKAAKILGMNPHSVREFIGS